MHSQYTLQQWRLQVSSCATYTGGWTHYQAVNWAQVHVNQGTIQLFHCPRTHNPVHCCNRLLFTVSANDDNSSKKTVVWMRSQSFLASVTEIIVNTQCLFSFCSYALQQPLTWLLVEYFKAKQITYCKCSFTMAQASRELVKYLQLIFPLVQ